MTLDNHVLWRSLRLTRLQLLVATRPLNGSLHALRQDVNTCRAWKEGLFHCLPKGRAGQPTFSSKHNACKTNAGIRDSGDCGKNSKKMGLGSDDTLTIL